MNKDANYAYREATIRSAGQVELVVMMYDMIIQDLRRAIDAIRQSDVEARTNEIKHALSVLEQLQGSLDVDHGGDAADHLDSLYSVARAKLLEGHLKVSPVIFESQLRIFTELREAWQKSLQVPTSRQSGEWPGAQVSVNADVETGNAASWTA